MYVSVMQDRVLEYLTIVFHNMFKNKLITKIRQSAQKTHEV